MFAVLKLRAMEIKSDVLVAVVADADGLIDASVMTEERTVVSACISYDPLGNCVHKVKARWALSSWYLLISSFGVSVSSGAMSRMEVSRRLITCLPTLNAAREIWKRFQRLSCTQLVQFRLDQNQMKPNERVDTRNSFV